MSSHTNDTKSINTELDVYWLLLFSGMVLSAMKRDIIQEASTRPALSRSKYTYEFVLQQMYRRVTLIYATEGNNYLIRWNQPNSKRPTKLIWMYKQRCHSLKNAQS